MTYEHQALLYLVRLGIGNNAESGFDFTGVDWRSLVDSSFAQAVPAIAVDGLQKLFESNPSLELPLDKPELEALKYEWFGAVMSAEQDYQSYLRALEKLAGFYKSQGVPMMLLKGYGLSLNYPVPSHRPVGDIDIYLWDRWQEADRMVEEKLGISVDNSHHHHSVFGFEGYSVENHYDFVNVHSHRSGSSVEALFKSLAEDKGRAVRHLLPRGTEIFLPSPDLNALFIARHCAAHFAAEKMNLRQLLDWALFVAGHHQEVDWSLFWSEAEKMGMEKFVLCVDAIAVEQLGFDASIFHVPVGCDDFAAHNRVLVARVLEDILSPADFNAKGLPPVRYVWRRLRCWWHNRWKHRIVYRDSLLSTFFVQLRSHLMKPKTIVGR